MPEVTPAPPPIAGYRPVKYIGSGGFGDVFRYEHTATLAAVAVKVLRDGVLAAGAAQQLLHEAQALGRLSASGPHPNIVAVQDVGTAGGRPYLMMEFCPGGSWADEITRRGRVHPSKVLSVGIQIAGALYMAHQAGIVHRDIKPGNILMGANVGGHGIPKLADFGIAAVTAEELARGSAWLSHDYAAPEVVESGESDELSDLFSFAATLYHALAGRSWVYEAGGDNSPTARDQRIHQGKVPPIGGDTPESLEWLLRAAMSGDRTIRGRSVQDAREFALRLRDIQFELRYDRTPVPIDEVGEHTGPRRVTGKPAASAASAPDRADRRESAGSGLGMLGGLERTGRRGEAPGDGSPAGKGLRSAGGVADGPDGGKGPSGKGPSGKVPSGKVPSGKGPSAVAAGGVAEGPGSGKGLSDERRSAERTGERPSRERGGRTGLRRVWASRVQEHAAMADTYVREKPVRLQAMPRLRRLRGLALALAAVVVVGTGAAFAFTSLEAPTGTTPPAQTTGPEGQPAVSDKQPVPVPVVTGNRLDADSVEFTWTYKDPQRGDTFRILRDGALAERSNVPKWTVHAPGAQLCVEVMVVREDARTTTMGGRACA